MMVLLFRHFVFQTFDESIFSWLVKLDLRETFHFLLYGVNETLQSMSVHVTSIQC